VPLARGWFPIRSDCVLVVLCVLIVLAIRIIRQHCPRRNQLSVDVEGTEERRREV
jgi:hypothetical protein